MRWFRRSAPVDDLLGRTFVYTPNNYAVRVVSVHREGPEGPWMLLESFESSRPSRRLELPLAKRQLLREPADRARAIELEDIIVHARAVDGQAHLDLRLYILGTQEQAAAAVATLMDRTEMDPPDRRAQVDLMFLGTKILGELAYARDAAANVEGYVATLQARRRTVPAADRVLTVERPIVPPIPTRVLALEEIASAGWHVAPSSIAASTQWLFGDGHTDDFQLVHEHQLPAGGGDWYVSIHQLGDERIDWVVLSRGAPYTIAQREAELVAVGPSGAVPIAKVAKTGSETGVLAFWGDPPADAGRAMNHTPPGVVFVWPFGVAVEIGRHGQFDVYGVSSTSGLGLWATHIPWEDE